MGRIFSHHFCLFISCLKSPFAHIRLTSLLKEDVLVWAGFLDTYSGQSFFQMDFILVPDFRLFTDAVC